MNEKQEATYKPSWEWLGRSLSNYKDMHASTAAQRKVSVAFLAAKTLTQAKKVLFGLKRGMTK